MELPLAEVVLSPRLHLRKAYVLERRPFLFAKSQTDCLGIRAPLKGRGGQTLPAHRRKARLVRSGDEERGIASRGRRVRYLVSGARGRAVLSRSSKRSETVKPPRLPREGRVGIPLSPVARTRASEPKSAWRGATPPPSRQAKRSAISRGYEAS